MTHSNRNRLLVALAVSALITTGLVIGWFRLLSIFGDKLVLPRPGTAAEVTAMTGAAPPAQATRIMLCSYQAGTGGSGFFQYIRFEAPPDVCLAYARQLIPQFEKVAASIDKDHRYVESYYFGDMSWFDIDKAENLVGATSPDDTRMNVYVDQSRGVFYYLFR